MALSKECKKHYRSLGHNLKPVVTIASKGLTENVVAELDRALEDHELIKVKLMVDDREMRSQVLDEICRQSGAENVQQIGKVALLYRAAKKPNPRLSNLARV